MRYTIEIEINKPIEVVVEKMDSSENLKHWQPGFISLQHLSGEPGQVGAKSEMHYKMGKREMVLTETIVRRDFPNHFDATYEGPGAFNEQKNEFVALDTDRTKWLSHCYFKLSGFMRVMGWLMPGSFRKQSSMFMDNFKAFVEEGKSVAETQ